MNIARVEYYFSDFLSCLESGKALHLHDEGVAEASGERRENIPAELLIPQNVFITGTVNVDETTYNFSPKVLDRAFTIELNRVDLSQLGNREPVSADNVPLYINNLPPVLGAGEAEVPGPSTDWVKFKALQDGALGQVVVALNDLLTPQNRHFGYRVANEIARFTNLTAEQAGEDKKTLWAALDLALMAKVLPKLHGTQQELEGILHELFCFAVAGSHAPEGESTEAWEVVGDELRRIRSEEDEAALRPQLPRTAIKTFRMIGRLRRQGFTSFIE